MYFYRNFTDLCNYEINRRILMRKIVKILVGIPGSGKSYYAGYLRTDDTIIINADSCRKALYGDENIQGNGSEVFAMVYNMFRTALHDNNVSQIVIDNTNTTYKARKAFYDIISEERKLVDVELVFFYNFQLAYERNYERERIVPIEVMDRMANQFQFPTQEEIYSGYDFKFIK